MSVVVRSSDTSVNAPTEFCDTVVPNNQSSMAVVSITGRVVIVDMHSPSRAVQLEGVNCIYTTFLFSGDGTRVFLGSFGALNIFDTRTGVRVDTIILPNKKISHMAWCSDGRRILIHYQSEDFDVCDLVSHRHLAHRETYKYSSYVCSDWSADTKHIASVSSCGSLEVYDAKDLFALIITRSTQRSYCHVSWNPDGSRIAVGHDDGTIEIWEFSSFNLDRLYSCVDQTGYITNLSWSRDGKYLLSRSRNGVRVLDTANGKGIFSRRAASHGTSWISDDNSFVVWHLLPSGCIGYSVYQVRDDASLPVPVSS